MRRRYSVVRNAMSANSIAIHYSLMRIKCGLFTDLNVSINQRRTFAAGNLRWERKKEVAVESFLYEQRMSRICCVTNNAYLTYGDIFLTYRAVLQVRTSIRVLLLRNVSSFREGRVPVRDDIKTKLN